MAIGVIFVKEQRQIGLLSVSESHPHGVLKILVLECVKF